MLAFALITIAVLAVSTTAQTGSGQNGLPVVYGFKSCQRCPAKTFYNDCNRCTCSKDGYDAACTKIGCPDTKPGTVPQRPLYAPCYKSGDKCPAKYFNDGCNGCTCQADGVTATCTLKLCISKNKRPCKKGCKKKVEVDLKNDLVDDENIGSRNLISSD